VGDGVDPVYPRFKRFHVRAGTARFYTPQPDEIVLAPHRLTSIYQPWSHS